MSVPANFDHSRYGLLTDLVDDAGYQRSIDRFRSCGIVLPTFAQLADPSRIPDGIRARLTGIDRDAADPLNLFRVHWYNDLHGGIVDVPEHVVLPTELTGVAAPIIVAFGNRFPMIGAHKVLAAYACLVPRIVTGQFDPTVHRAIWPSTGNYARGGVAISTLMDSRGVAVLPENMSRERFEWLDRWIADPDDVIRTTGSESNVKEIYDACDELSLNPQNFIFNQFTEFANHVGHHEVTGRALEHVYVHNRDKQPGLKLAAFVAASGSSGTLAAGERLKSDHGARIVAVEALECPTMLNNGFGEHNIQGIGDKHIPLIHNVTNTDVIVAVSDRACDELGVTFSTDAGRDLLADEHGVDRSVIDQLCHLGLSSICNVLASIKTARTLDLGPEDGSGQVRRRLRHQRGGRRHRRTPCRCRRDQPRGSGRLRTGPHLQPRLLHLGGTTGRGVRRLRSSPEPVLLEADPGSGAGMGRHDRRVQRPDGRIGRLKTG